MALALIRSMERLPGVLRLAVDIGSNRYLEYVIGGQARERRHGLEWMAAPADRSELIGPLPAHSRGRTTLEVPLSRLEGHGSIQIASYAGRDRRGPAISGVLQLPLPRLTGEMPPAFYREQLPALAFGATAPMQREAEATMQTYGIAHTSDQPRRFAYRRRELSEAQEAITIASVGALLTSLLPIAAKVLPVALPALASMGPVVANLLAGLGGGARPMPAGAAFPAPMPDNRQMNQLLQQAGNVQISPEELRQLIQAMEQLMGATAGAQVAAAASTRPARLAMAQGARREPLSEAFLEPATLLAGLTTLLPLLQQVLTPETIQGVLDAPGRTTGQIMNAIGDLARVGMEFHEQERAHLRALNPGVDDPALDALLASLALGGATRGLPRYRRVGSVSLEFGGHAETVSGRHRIIYRGGRTWRFPARLRTPQTIANSQLVLQVKDPETLEVLISRRWPMDELHSGPLPVVAVLEEGHTRRLENGRDYIVVLTLVWRNRQGEWRGTSRQEGITVAGEWVFERFEEGGAIHALNDPARYRDYWHRVWEGRLDDRMRRVQIETAYYTLLASGGDRHHRLEPRMRALAADRGRQRFELEAGLELAPAALARLREDLLPGAGPLPQGLLEAFNDPELRRRYSLGGRHTAEFRGRRGDRVALWVYPEFRLQTAVFRQPADTDRHGQVTRWQETRTDLPMPVQLHFVGATTE